MADENSQFDSLNEQARLVNIALKYTGGDLERAKLMASGQFDDVRIIKGRFASDNVLVYGIFIIFINFVNRYIMNTNSLILSSRNIFNKAKIFDGWKSFYSDFESYIQHDSEEVVDSHDFSDHLSSSIVGYDIFSRVGSDNLDILTADIKEITGKFFNDYRLQCQIEIEKVSSLSLELGGVPLEIPEDDLPPKTDEQIISEEDKVIAPIEEQAEYIVEGRIIVSPVKGKYINDIKVGESIKVLLSEKDEVSLSIAKMLNVYSDEGDYLPIKARIKAKVPIGGGGYIIYGVIAKDTLIKIIEEENVKIEMDSAQNVTVSQKDESHLLLYIALLLGIITLSLLIGFFTL